MGLVSSWRLVLQLVLKDKPPEDGNQVPEEVAADPWPASWSVFVPLAQSASAQPTATLPGWGQSGKGQLNPICVTIDHQRRARLLMIGTG